MSTGTDVKYGEEKAKEAKIFINKLYNASKFVVQNLKDVKICSIESLDLMEKDKWILLELDKLIKSVNKNIDKYAFGVATSNLIEFTVSKFCDWYIELSKVDLYGADESNKNKTQNVLLYVLSNLLKLFHPFIPFVTEYIYQELPNSQETIMLAEFPKKVQCKRLKNNFDRIIEIVRLIRNARAEFNVPDNKNVSIFLHTNKKDKTIEEKIETIAKKVYGADGVQFTPEAKEQIEIFNKNGWGKLPICMAKTQMSLSDDGSIMGRPQGFTITVRELRPSLGAGFIVALTGKVLTMPGLPKHPSALDMDIDEDGKIKGLF